MRQVCGLLPLMAPCRAFVTSLLAPGALQPAGSTSDALEAIIRLARGIPVRIWPPRQRSSRNRLFGHVSNNSNRGRYARLLGNLMPEGRVLTECPISTADGVKAADVA